MSRCFPFPPPGYEKKTRPGDADVLKKDKQKEKKHKTEKKDKEKREGKEKRGKDRSDGKNREKKDKKEKHRDKKKDKEKDREKDKEKGSTREEKRVSGQLEDYNGAQLHHRERERDKEKISTSEEKRQTGQNSLLDKDSEDSENSKFMLELGRRIRDEEKGTGSQSVQGFTGMDWKKDEGIERFAVRDTIMVVEDKEKNKDKRVDNRKMDAQRIGLEAKFGGNAMAQNFAGSVQNKVGVPVPKSMEKVEGRMEGKEKSKEREGDGKRGDKRKSKDKEKQSQGKDKNREKDKKKEEKAKEKKEHKKSEKDKIKNSSKNDLIGALNNKTSHLSKDDDDKNAATEGNLKKRKDMEKNGFLHDNELRHEKVARLTSHLLSENGKKLEPSQAPILFTPDRQGSANNLKVDNKHPKINGLIGAQPLSVAALTPSPVIAEQIAEASRKPPHPDTKDLSKVLSVPQLGEWSDLDDQEWLFSTKDCPLKKPGVGSVRVNKEQQVWAEALQIESADVCALPYVIPY